MNSGEWKVESAGLLDQASRCGFVVICFLLLSTLHSPLSTFAQDDPPEIAPPPLKIVSKNERLQLDAKVADVKERTKLALVLMDLRLDTAEKLAVGRQFDAMFTELGGFQALMDDSLEFLGRRDTGKNGKVLDNYKRIEIGLRSFSPRIETLRRELPPRYDDYVRKLMKFVRDARTKATEPLFGDSVVPNRRSGSNL